MRCQGYEPFALKLLEESGYGADDLLTSKKRVPAVWYTFPLDVDKKKHRYYMDIYIPQVNIAIEVKSDLYFIKNIEKIIETRKAVLRLGMKYLLWIFDEKGNLNQKAYNEVLTDKKHKAIKLQVVY